ncbi:MAG: hypothetical protein Q8R37_04750 [Nanoarchaeota archaeon]|nr:hypothetical protein [Nanoarchaeota archaeon]
MSLEIYLSEGPNVEGLSEGRIALYVGYSDSEPGKVTTRGKVWWVIEGRKIGTPLSYKIHVGNHGTPLTEAIITKFEHDPLGTSLDFILEDTKGRLMISNISPHGHYCYYQHHNRKGQIQTVYNLFGSREATALMPNGVRDYFDFD